jgi:hypothetical protein
LAAVLRGSSPVLHPAINHAFKQAAAHAAFLDPNKYHDAGHIDELWQDLLITLTSLNASGMVDLKLDLGGLREAHANVKWTAADIHEGHIDHALTDYQHYQAQVSLSRLFSCTDRQ